MTLVITTKAKLLFVAAKSLVFYFCRSTGAEQVLSFHRSLGRSHFRRELHSTPLQQQRRTAEVILGSSLFLSRESERGSPRFPLTLGSTRQRRATLLQMVALDREQQPWNDTLAELQALNNQLKKIHGYMADRNEAAAAYYYDEDITFCGFLRTISGCSRRTTFNADDEDPSFCAFLRAISRCHC